MQEMNGSLHPSTVSPARLLSCHTPHYPFPFALLLPSASESRAPSRADSARSGNVEVTRVLMQFGAGVDLVDGLRRTPLLLAAFAGHKVSARHASLFDTIVTVRHLLTGCCGGAM